MNVIIQCLFYTKEFRELILSQKIDLKNESTSIKYQLKLIFEQLQKGDTVVSKKGLVNAFGWIGLAFKIEDQHFSQIWSWNKNRMHMNFFFCLWIV